MSNTFWIAPTGAIVNSDGCCECDEYAIILANGFRPFAVAFSAEVKTKADAPSEIELALAAVIVPSFAKAGRKVGIEGLFILINNNIAFTT